MRIQDTLWCDGCGVEVLWAPIKSGERDYCCQNCADGFECNCGARMEEDGYTRRGNKNSGDLGYEIDTRTA